MNLPARVIVRIGAGVTSEKSQKRVQLFSHASAAYATLPFGLTLLMLFAPQASVAGGATNTAAPPGLPHAAEENRAVLGWLRVKKTGLTHWLENRGKENGPPEAIDFYLNPQPIQLQAPLESEMKVAQGTKSLFNHYFPQNDPSSYVGTFFESANPHIETPEGPFQWNSHYVSGMESPALFEESVKTLTGLGFKNIRIGPNLFELDPNNPESWNHFLDKIEVIWRYGATATISVAFFPSLERWRVAGTGPYGIDAEKSYLLNPKWPTDMGKLSRGLMQQLWKRAAAFEALHPQRLAQVILNPINEPETLAGFNRQFWHGAIAPWGDPETLRFYIPSVIAIAKANVLIRLAAEKASPGKRILFMHNEAMTPFYYPSHKGYGRFAVSKFMLGDQSLMNAQFEKIKAMPLESLRQALNAEFASKTINEVHWSLKEFIFGSWNQTPAQQEKARQEIIAQFEDLQQTHLALFKSVGKTMKTDTMFMADYYYQTEFKLNRSTENLISELAAQQGEKLKLVLDIKGDAEFVTMLQHFAGLAKERNPQIAGIFHGEMNRSQIDFKSLLSSQDAIMLETMIGLRNDYQLSGDANFVALRTKAGIPPGKFNRTDQLLTDLVANQAALLNSVLDASPGNTLREKLTLIGANTSDGSPAIEVLASDSIEQILNRHDRTILHRIFGIKRERLLGFEPNTYPRQIRAGIRDGFYKYSMQYINALRIFTFGVGESGTPFHVYAPMLHDQVMMEYATVLKSGVYGTQYSLGPAVDSRGWAKGPLSLSLQNDVEVNPSGLLSLKVAPVQERAAFHVVPRNWQSNPPWAGEFLNPLFAGLKPHMAAPLRN
jgi:hypothetical protein